MPLLVRRRHILKTLFLGSALSRLGKTSSAQTIQLEAEMAPSRVGVLKVHLSDFPVLNQPYGSVRIGTSAIDPNNMPTGVFYPVLINRGPDLKLYALDTSCSHAGCTVPPIDPDAELIQCRCHGSQYAFDGSLLQGPAGFGLRSFKISLDSSGELRIEIPGQTYSVEAKKIGLKGRLAFEFLTFQNIEYEIRFHSSWDAASTIIPFSLEPDGALNQTVFPGIDDFVTVYVDATSKNGFVQAAMRVKEV